MLSLQCEQSDSDEIRGPPKKEDFAVSSLYFLLGVEISLAHSKYVYNPSLFCQDMTFYHLILSGPEWFLDTVQSRGTPL